MKAYFAEYAQFLCELGLSQRPISQSMLTSSSNAILIKFSWVGFACPLPYLWTQGGAIPNSLAIA